MTLAIGPQFRGVANPGPARAASRGRTDGVSMQHMHDAEVDLATGVESSLMRPSGSSAVGRAEVHFLIQLAHKSGRIDAVEVGPSTGLIWPPTPTERRACRRCSVPFFAAAIVEDLLAGAKHDVGNQLLEARIVFRLAADEMGGVGGEQAARNERNRTIILGTSQVVKQLRRHDQDVFFRRHGFTVLDRGDCRFRAWAARPGIANADDAGGRRGAGRIGWRRRRQEAGRQTRPG